MAKGIPPVLTPTGSMCLSQFQLLSTLTLRDIAPPQGMSDTSKEARQSRRHLKTVKSKKRIDIDGV